MSTKAWIYKTFNKHQIFGKAFQAITREFTHTMESIEKKGITVMLTVDTEPGYVRKNEERVWEYMDEKASVGYTAGVRNILEVAEKLNIPTTFFVSNQCDLDLLKQTKLPSTLDHNEIGVHLHPGKHANAYSLAQQKEMLVKEKNRIKEAFGIAPISFRFGVWGANEDTFQALQETGYKIDSSICPGVKAHEGTDRAYDWSQISSVDPFMVTADLLEIPATTFTFFSIPKYFRADPLYNPLTLNAFRGAVFDKKPIFVISTHSSEATYADGSPTINLKNLTELLKYTKTFKNTKHTTLKYYLENGNVILPEDTSERGNP